MSGFDGDVVYNFGTISTISSQIATFCTQLQQDLDDVNKRFKGLLEAGWQGAGADAFGPCQAKWQANADAMKQTLQSLSAKVDQAGMDMQAADQAAAARF
jgi:WXG100 family type VII secretion target